MDNNQINDKVFTLAQMQEQTSTIFNIINEVKPILNEEDTEDTVKLVKIMNLIGIMFGAGDYAIKKMKEAGKTEITGKEILEYGQEYMKLFVEHNNIEE